MNNHSPAGKATVHVTFELEYTDPEAITQTALERLSTYEMSPAGEAEERELIRQNLKYALYEVLDLHAITEGTDHVEVMETNAEVVLKPAAAEEPEEDVEERFVEEGKSLSGVDFLDDVFLGEALPAAEAATERRKVELLKGVLAHASALAVDELFADVVALGKAGFAEEPGAWEETNVIAYLPPRFGKHYNALFAKKFLVAMVDITGGLANGWSSLPTLAHELALHVLLKEAETVAELHDLTLPEHWPETLGDVLFEDHDFELLYLPEFDGIEDQPSKMLGMAPMDFASWFKPFNPERFPSPYARD